MVSAALQPNLANVSTAFILCSALYILMALLVLFLVQDFHRSSGSDAASRRGPKAALIPTARRVAYAQIEPH